MFIIFPIAGVGKRLQPFTFSKPKAFIKVAGQRLIDHILNKLKQTFPEGTEILFIVGYMQRQISDYLESKYSDYFTLYFKEQKPQGYIEDTPYFSGLGDAILLAKEDAKDKDIFICLSDRLPLEDYSSLLLDFHKNTCDGIINTKKVDNPQFYGITKIDEEGYIKDIVEKPTQFISNLAVSGAYLFSKDISSHLFGLLEEQSKIELENGEEHQFTPIIETLIKEGKRIRAHIMKKEILDFGRPDSLLKGNKYLLSEVKLKNPLLDDNQEENKIEDCKIIPPVCVGENATIKDSVIGPNVSIGDNVFLNKCILKNSVLGDGVHLEKIISKSSIFGDYCTLQGLIKKGVTIGDSAYVHTYQTRESYNDK
ncbi:MAG: NDP-sugar synthase [Promethearchaeota archaeon]|nr:MAG: NDP-sugar synthase [Candidatus Lokiarchaeota archaeon]